MEVKNVHVRFGQLVRLRPEAAGHTFRKVDTRNRKSGPSTPKLSRGAKFA